MILSVGIVAYNEEKYLPKILTNIEEQTFNHREIEVLLIDSMSTDSTRKIMDEFKSNHSDFYDIKVLSNSKKIQAAGWNIAIDNFSGFSLTRIDAHSKVPSDFLEKIATELSFGEKVVGGIRPCLIDEETPWKKTLLMVENSLFGSSINSSRHSVSKQYVKTMFHATYTKEVLDKVGHFNENLLRTEDNEFHYRVRINGFKLCYNPSIISYQYSRPSLIKMIHQKYSNGYWIGKTVKCVPGCLSIYHFIPFCFFLTVIASVVLCFFNLWLVLAFLGAIYFLFCLINTVISAFNEGPTRYIYLMPFLFLILHISYGFGTMIGILSINKFKCKTKG